MHHESAAKRRSATSVLTHCAVRLYTFGTVCAAEDMSTVYTVVASSFAPSILDSPPPLLGCLQLVDMADNGRVGKQPSFQQALI